MAKSADAFRTISEVADWLGTPAHVLRFWESKFSQVKPVKRAGGRRYYRPTDMMLLGGLKKLLHEDGMTIKGAQALLREKGIKHVAALSAPLDGSTTTHKPEPDIEIAAQEPVALEGIPPANLGETGPSQEPEQQWRLEQAEEAVEMLPLDQDHGPADPVEEQILFEADNLEHADHDQPPHFLQSAGQEVDGASPPETQAEDAPIAEPPAPAGPLRLEELRTALKVTIGIDPEVLGQIRTDLITLRDRLANSESQA